MQMAAAEDTPNPWAASSSPKRNAIKKDSSIARPMTTARKPDILMMADLLSANGTSYLFLFQKTGVNSKLMVNSSNRPAIISRDSSSLDAPL